MFALLLIPGPAPGALAASTVSLSAISTRDTLGESAPGQPGVFPPLVYSLRAAIHEANGVAAGAVVTVHLLADRTYLIERSTVHEDSNTEQAAHAALDPYHGDFDITRSLTIEGNNATIDAQQMGRIFQIVGPIQVRLRNLTLRNGGGAVPLGGGGALWVDGGAAVTLENVRFVDNTITAAYGTGLVDLRGGAVYLWDGSLDILGGRFENNGVQGSPGRAVTGGAIYQAKGTLTIDGTEFVRCWAWQQQTVAGEAARGGAIRTEAGTLTIRNALFEANAAYSARGFDSSSAAAGDGHSSEGGALFIGPEVTGLTIADTRFVHNTAKSGRGGQGAGSGGVSGKTAGAARGGALFIAPGASSLTTTIERSQFVENHAFAGDGGQGAYFGNGGNGGWAEGGAIFVRRGLLDLEDTSFRGNAAVGGDGGQGGVGHGGNGGPARGGAIYSSHETTRVRIRGIMAIHQEGQAETFLTTALLEGNHALGGSGRPGNINEVDGSSGRGGVGEGGALAIFAPRLDLVRVTGRYNSAQGGKGADGLGFIQDQNWGGPGCSNGAGRGGFAAVWSDLTQVRESILIQNRAAGGRIVAKVRLLVPPENQGEYWATTEEEVVPFVAGVGRALSGSGAGGSGGDGGEAVGGAIVVHQGRLEVAESVLSVNEVLGGNGGPGGAGLAGETGQRPGGRGGNGGGAHGGAIRIAHAASTFHITDSILRGNLVVAGRGGTGGRAGDTTGGRGDAGDGGGGGSGGDGGTATGGAISSLAVTATPASDARLERVLASENKVVAGDGWFGGSGGLGAGRQGGPGGWGGFGGTGGHGGTGGSARGGAIEMASLWLINSTLDQNVVSGGWGGAGGHGSSGRWVGGQGGFGGPTGDAAGGGINIAAPAPMLSKVVILRSTIANNRVFSGFGGLGGGGGIGNLGGGNGGNGGNSRPAQGGGVNNGFGVTLLEVTDSTIARNLINSGSGGSLGLRGVRASDFSYATVPTRYQAAAQPGRPILHGAASVLEDPTTGHPVGHPVGPEYSAPDIPWTTGDADYHVYGNADLPDWLETASNVIGGAGIVTGVGAGLAAAGASVLIANLAVAVEIGVSSTAIVGLGTGGVTFISVFGGFSMVTVGVVVGTKVLAAGISTGDWEAAVRFALGDPGNVVRNNISILLTGAGPLDDGLDPNDPTLVFESYHGNPGASYPAEGMGINGGGSLQGTLISNNTARQRSRPATEKEVVVDVFYRHRVMEYTETESDVSFQVDVVGTYQSHGGNFLGSVNLFPALGTVFPPHGTDRYGSIGSRLDARVAAAVADHGGGMLTLKLLPGSPARGALQHTGASGISQNGYPWTTDSHRDIGAWGGPPNRPPTAEPLYFRLSPGQPLTFLGRDVLGAARDPDDDDLHFTELKVTQGDGTWANFSVDPGGPVHTTYHFTPSSSITGLRDIIHYRVSDGEFESGLGAVTLQIVPAADADRCPERDADRLMVISSETTTAHAARRVELPDPARADHSFTGPFTVEFWMAMTRPGGWANEHEALVTKGDSAWRVARGGATSKLSFDVTGLEPLVLRSTRDVVGGWHHVAAVYDGHQKRLYIDGELDAWTEVTGTPAVNHEPVWLGANSQRPGRDFRGFMDEVRVWNHARSGADIRDNMVRTLTGHEPGLLTYYRFDEPAGDAVLNRGLAGIAQPGTAIRLNPDTAPDRYPSSISRAASPVLWEFGTAVLGRHVFFNDSPLDGNDPGPSAADDDAVSSDVQPLLPGNDVVSANTSSYSRGINGVMVDIARLRAPGEISASDFTFVTRLDGNPNDWSPAPPPRHVHVRSGAGPCDSSRITLIWDDHHSGTAHAAVANGWLRIRVLANERTGLLMDDVFTIGSHLEGTADPGDPGDSGGGGDVRTVWQLGVDDDPAVLPYRPTAEFSQENGRNDASPGRVSRWPGDPQYVTGSNPEADDDYYFAGRYPAGFNGLAAELVVPNDEPWWAWERAHTIGDRTNRVHFVLEGGQVGAGRVLRLDLEWVNGGWMLNGIKQPGFGEHEMVVRFRNGAGVGTVLWSSRVAQGTPLALEWTTESVQATPGANSVEIVRTGPAGAGVSYWIQYDHLRIEAIAAATGSGVTAARDPRGGDGDPGGIVPLTGQRCGWIHEGGETYLTLEFLHPEPDGPRVRYALESSEDFLRWTECEAIVVASETLDGMRFVVLRDPMPLSSADRRFLRVRAALSPQRGAAY
ncbi:MAG: hypothetical protein KF791_14005 [Verrucomicrobiae bacterium]|nr:hypothetical protein [Verrucomicrobiae bacterium]